MLSLAAALRQLKGFYQLFRCWIMGRAKLSKGKQSQGSASTVLAHASAHIMNTSAKKHRQTTVMSDRGCTLM